MHSLSLALSSCLHRFNSNSVCVSILMFVNVVSNFSKTVRKIWMVTTFMKICSVVLGYFRLDFYNGYCLVFKACLVFRFLKKLNKLLFLITRV